jgi:uracil phosphoribosyltransferase
MTPAGVVAVDHPLVAHKLGLLRDRSTPAREVRALVRELALLLTYEATKDFPVEEVEVETPLEPTRVARLSGKKLAVCPILRAGLGMLDGVLALVPAARVGFIGLYRDETTLEPVDYYAKLPEALADRFVLLLDPMLATGGSTCRAARLVKEVGAERVRLVALVAAPEGVARMREEHPDVGIVCAAVDRALDERGYIRPGLGDAGDRLYGTR